MILRNPDSNATTHRSPAVFPLYVCHATPASLLSHFQTLKIQFVFDLLHLFYGPVVRRIRCSGSIHSEANTPIRPSNPIPEAAP
jgi:hypothetical protein